MEVKWLASRPGRFTPREGASGTPLIGGWVGTRAVLDAVVKRKIPSPRRESNPRPQIFLLQFSVSRIEVAVCLRIEQTELSF